MDKISIEMSNQEKRIIKEALKQYVHLHLGCLISNTERLTLSVIVDIVDKMPDKIYAPIKTKIKFKYFEAFYIVEALKKVMSSYDSMFEYEYVVINEVKDKLLQKL
jgi:hypothetical protein